MRRDGVEGVSLVDKCETKMEMEKEKEKLNSRRLMMMVFVRLFSFFSPLVRLLPSFQIRSIIYPPSLIAQDKPPDGKLNRFRHNRCASLLTATPLELYSSSAPYLGRRKFPQFVFFFIPLSYPPHSIVSHHVAHCCSLRYNLMLTGITILHVVASSSQTNTPSQLSLTR